MEAISVGLPISKLSDHSKWDSLSEKTQDDGANSGGSFMEVSPKYDGAVNNVFKKKFDVGDFQRYLLESSETAIGLKYVEEYRYPTFPEPYFKCVICPAQGYGNMMIQHLFGKKHTHSVLYKGYHIGINKTNLVKYRREIANLEGKQVLDIRIITGHKVLDEMNPHNTPGLAKYFSNSNCAPLNHTTTDVIFSQKEVILRRNITTGLVHPSPMGLTPRITPVDHPVRAPPGRNIISYSDVISDLDNGGYSVASSEMPRAKRPRREGASRWSPRDEMPQDHFTPHRNVELGRQELRKLNGFDEQALKKLDIKELLEPAKAVHEESTQTDLLCNNGLFPNFGMGMLLSYLSECSVKNTRDFELASSISFPLLASMLEYQSKRLNEKDGQQLAEQLEKTIQLFANCSESSYEKQAPGERASVKRSFEEVS